MIGRPRKVAVDVRQHQAEPEQDLPTKAGEAPQAPVLLDPLLLSLDYALARLTMLVR